MRAAIDRLRRELLGARNADGAWGYYRGKSSRLEPTCWTLLALSTQIDQRPPPDPDPAIAWLERCDRANGWLVEHEEWPFNIAYNALATFTLLSRSDAAAALGRRLLATVIASKGLSAPQENAMRQNNSLQGWSWIDGTFSWVEPTCWGLLALKKARTAGIVDAQAAARIDEAERLLIDRSCQPGGWNFGNASVMRQDLRPYVPTTALGLLAMQDRRDTDAVRRGLSTLDSRWPEERSASSLGLSLISLGVHGQPTDRVAQALVDHAADAITFGNHHGLAVALFALSSLGQRHVFAL
ncbi:MAG TPA: hypothetical protein VFV78_11725 [Vicinamibacterales bacterium]|nr:hypothetical protein [Vicinamibacterales bacterium]